MEVYAVMGWYDEKGADELTLRLFSDLTEAEDYDVKLIKEGAVETVWRCLTLNDKT